MANSLSYRTPAKQEELELADVVALSSELCRGSNFCGATRAEEGCVAKEGADIHD